MSECDVRVVESVFGDELRRHKMHSIHWHFYKTARDENFVDKKAYYKGLFLRSTISTYKKTR